MTGLCTVFRTSGRARQARTGTPVERRYDERRSQIPLVPAYTDTHPTVEGEIDAVQHPQPSQGRPS